VVDFKMSTNNNDMGDFDDVVMEIELINGEHHVFALKLKHIVRPIAQVNLVTNNKKFSLKKYSKAFKKVKTNYGKSQSYSAAFQNFHFILFSNSLLEKHEEIGEDWSKLEPFADGKKIDSDILIRKFDDCFEKKFLNFGETDSGINYKIKCEKEGSPDEEFFNQFSFYTKQKTAKETEAIKLCDTNGRKKKFLLLEETNLEDTSDWTIFRNLSDLRSATNFYNVLTQRLSVSVQGRLSILLKELLQIDESLVNTITIEEIVLMLDGTFLIGDDCKKHFPKYYVPRQVPKILINNEIIDELDDLFVVSYSDDVDNIYTNFCVNTVDINKYLLLKPQGASISYKSKQFSASYLVNIEEKEQVMNSKFVILAKGGCPKEQFDEICLMNSTKNCHHVHFIDNQIFEWMESRGSINEIQNYQLNSKELKSKDFVPDSDVFTHLIVPHLFGLSW
jgi:hypothetical protein